jgi:hypothetical protein
MTVAELAQSSRAWFLRRKLDRKIAQGADPASSPELSCRARQLVSPGFRARMAAGLRRTIAAAEQPRPSPLSARVPVQRRAILDERERLLGLARALTDEETVSARGVARVEELLTDGRSPIYYPSPAGALRAALLHTRATLLLGEGATPVRRGHLTDRRSAARLAGWFESRNSGFSEADW